MKKFFNNFPDLEDAAIDAIYDLCEDQDPMVRFHPLQSDRTISSHIVYRFVLPVTVPFCRYQETNENG